MGRYDDDNWWNPTEQDRPTFVESQLNRIGISLKTSDLIGGTPEPAQTEQQAREARARLAAHDKLFGVDGTLAESLYRVSRPRYGVGDEAAD